jgi:hypothetical protein
MFSRVKETIDIEVKNIREMIYEQNKNINEGIEIMKSK